MNEKVEIEIAKRRLTVEIEGLVPLEISELARQVSAKMSEISAQNEKIHDSSKLAILTALDFAAELSKARNAHDTERRYVENRVDHVTLVLKTALSAAGRGE